MMKISGYLKGHLLISLPQKNDPKELANKNVLFVCKHDEEGAMGFMLNQKLEGVFLSDLIPQLEGGPDLVLPDDSHIGPPVLWGGPLETNRGFVLHSLDYKSPYTIYVDEKYGVTANNDILQDIFAPKKSMPENYALLLGYAAWKGGQLEKEVQEGLWLPLPAQNDLIFTRSHEDLWTQSLQQWGIDLTSLSCFQGSA